MAAQNDDGRTHLVESALVLLDEVHPEDLSIREVARRAGLSSGAPYHHFADKADLLAACAVVAWTELCERLEADGEGPAERRLIARAGNYLSFARARPGPYQLITSRLLDGDRRSTEIAALRARAVGGVIELIIAASEPAVDPPSAKFRGLALWSLLHGHLTLEGEPSLDNAVADLAAAIALSPTRSRALD